jgi:DNA-binding SARP family transcriptional activator
MTAMHHVVTAKAPVRLALQGSPCVRTAAGGSVALETKDAVLLARLALEGATDRGQIAAWLWPDAEPERARGNLRQRLLRLRRQAGAQLIAGTTKLALADGVEHDLTDDGDLLGTVPADAAAGLADWLTLRRERGLESRSGRLLQEAERAENAGDLAGALGFVKKALTLAPLSEPAHRALMRLHYLAGDRAAALLAYGHCRRQLAEALAVEPAAETEALKALIERAGSAPTAVAAPLPAAVLRPPRLIGRLREQAQIAAAAQLKIPVLVIGEAGMGKSRLLAESCATHDIGIAVAARPGDVDLPYALFARLVRRLLAEGIEPGPATRPELARFIVELGFAPETAFDLGALERAAEEYLAAACAQQPRLVIDDLHYADAASIELLERTAHSANAPHLLLGARPGDDGSALQRWQDSLVEQQRLELVRLGPLDAAELAALIDSLGVAALRGDALAGPLHRHTGGNPQFALETLRALLLDGRTDAFSRDALPLPASVGALIAARLKRLTPMAIKLARVSAVADAQFDADLAARVLGCEVLDLADAWSELEAAQVFCGDGFAHDLVADAVRRGVPQPIARRLHAGIASDLEWRNAAPAAVAHHWLAAGEAARACGPLGAAAGQATAASRHQEAAALYNELARVLAECGDPRGAWDARLRQFDALINAELGEAINAALRYLMDEAVDDRQHAQACEARARLALALLDNEQAAEAARSAAEAAQRAGAPAVECDARMALAQALLRLRRPDEAGAVLAGLQAWISASAAPEQRIQYEQCVAWHAIETERYDSALQLWERSTAAAIERRSMSEVATGMTYQVLCLGNMGAFRRAAEVGERQRALMAEYRLYGDPYPLIDSNLAYVYAYAGRYADALTALDRAAAAGVVDVATLGLRRAVVFLALGQAGRARRLLDDALTQGRVAVGRHPLLLMLARTRHALGARAPSGDGLPALLDEAEQLARDSPKVSLRARTLLVRAECAGGGEALEAGLEARRLIDGRDAHGLRLAIETRLAAAWLAQGDVGRALDVAQLPLALAEVYDPELMFASEVAALLWRVLFAAHDARAEPFLDAAVERIHRTAAEQVPAEFRDSYMNRFAANRELLTAATRRRPRAAPWLPAT